MIYLSKPPKSWVIPVTLGCDRKFTLRRKDAAGQLVNWDAEVYIVIDVSPTPTILQADIEGAIAAFDISSTVCDSVNNSTRWRIVMSDDADLETPLAVGKFERHDG